MRKRIICALLALSCITMMISGCTPDATVQTTQNAFETQEDGITIQMRWKSSSKLSKKKIPD